MIHHSIDHGYLRAVILYLLNPYPESRRRNFFGETDQLLYTNVYDLRSTEPVK